MKRLFFLVIVLALALTMLASCDTVKEILGTAPEKICQHRDADDNDLCDKCNEAYTDGTDLTHSHSFSAWTNYSANGNVSCEERLFYRTCETCGGIEWKTGTYAEHSFSTSIVEPTCKDEGTETRTCSICGIVETNSIPTTSHTYSTTYTSNNSFHWFECIHCEAKKDETEHTPDTEGFCSICNRPIGATEGVIYDKSADGTYAEVIGYSGSAKRVIIADTYNGLPVKSIYNVAFKNTNITEIVIPDSVTSIGDSAFYDCDGLTSVVIPDSVTSIGDYAFKFCYGLTSVVIEGAPNIGREAFSYCNSALYTEYELGRYVGTPDNPYKILVEITNANLSTYTIHEDTKVIAYGAFYDCTRLTEIVIPDSVTSIGEAAFYNCYDLTSIVIPDSVTSIGKWAFYRCDSLTSIAIPDSVTSIGEAAFSSCSKLTIYCEAESKPEGWNSNWNSSNRPVVWGYEGSEE